MSPLARKNAPGSAQASLEQSLMCPLCGQTGRAGAEGDGVVAFTLRGEDRGYPAWKCFVCNSGFAVKGANTQPISADRWALIEARYERERERADEIRNRLAQSRTPDQRA